MASRLKDGDAYFQCLVSDEAVIRIKRRHRFTNEFRRHGGEVERNESSAESTGKKRSSMNEKEHSAIQFERVQSQSRVLVSRVGVDVQLFFNFDSGRGAARCSVARETNEFLVMSSQNGRPISKPTIQSQYLEGVFEGSSAAGGGGGGDGGADWQRRRRSSDVGVARSTSNERRHRPHLGHSRFIVDVTFR